MIGDGALSLMVDKVAGEEILTDRPAEAGLEEEIAAAVEFPD